MEPVTKEHMLEETEGSRAEEGGPSFTGAGGGFPEEVAFQPGGSCMGRCSGRKSFLLRQGTSQDRSA